jgi:hypothetical protein
VFEEKEKPCLLDHASFALHEPTEKGYIVMNLFPGDNSISLKPIIVK